MCLNYWHACHLPACPRYITEEEQRGVEEDESVDDTSVTMLDRVTVSLEDMSGDTIVNLETREPLISHHRVLHKYSDEEVFSGSVKLSEDQLNQFIDGRTGWPKFMEVR